MATEHMMALGSLRFSMDTAAYEELRRSSSWRWVGLPRIGRVDAMQQTGREGERLDLQGVIYPHYKGSLRFLDSVREAGNAGTPLTLSDGRGNIYGQWVIEQMEVTHTVLFADGSPRKVEFRLGLTEYGSDG
jgi:phage protein U